MPTTIGVSPSHSGHGPLSSIRHAVRNFLERLGFKPLPASESSRSRKRMPRPSHAWGIPAFPRDYIRRRRVMRRISNVVIVVLLSTAIAYVIVHFSGPAAFSAPHR